MVQNLSKISKSKINVSITGIAGPGGATKNKPVGLVYIGVKVNDAIDVRQYNWEGNRTQNKIDSVTAALEMLNEMLHD